MVATENAHEQPTCRHDAEHVRRGAAASGKRSIGQRFAVLSANGLVRDYGKNINTKIYCGLYIIDLMYEFHIFVKKNNDFI